MFDYIYADFVLFLNVHFATSTLLNELLVNIDQQKVGFILIFAAKIEKNAKYFYLTDAQRKTITRSNCVLIVVNSA